MVTTAAVKASDVMPPAARRVRAYFAPVNRAVGVPVVVDPAAAAGWSGGVPPSPWVDLGWISGFVRRCGTKVEAVRAGSPAVTQMQVRTAVDATVEFAFASWGKLQMALACGTQQMNVLAVAAGGGVAAGSGGAGGVAVAAVPVLAGSTATVLQVAPAAMEGFAPGMLVVVDVDATGLTGFVGSGVSGAYLRAAVSDVDYARRVSLNVARVSSVSANGAVTLATPLVAGVPTTAMKVQPVVGFCDREGSSFFQEWSGLFVAEGQQGERVLWHYPRLQTMAGAAEEVSKAAGGMELLRLAGSFRALPVVDPVDGETVVCFRSYLQE